MADENMAGSENEISALSCTNELDRRFDYRTTLTVIKYQSLQHAAREHYLAKKKP
jgi:hypothetical protein